MRTTLQIPDHLVADSQLYAPSRSPLDAVCHLLADYPRLLAENRRMRSRLADFDRESAELDALLVAAQKACQRVIDL